MSCPRDIRRRYGLGIIIFRVGVSIDDICLACYLVGRYLAIIKFGLDICIIDIMTVR